MRKMTAKERKIIEGEIRSILARAVSWEYERYIREHHNEEFENSFMDDVIEDVMCSSAWDDEGYYNDDDIRLAIGRELIRRLEIEY